ncbi:MAG: TetR/AcrR family transcriptional regulator, partial [Actinomycetia bacterium]|nr:TetR/AcrR family transcriptional regulator [Actinomycetes bacterium]
MARPLSAEARDKILSAAGEILLDTGVSGFTVDAVVRRS